MVATLGEERAAAIAAGANGLGSAAGAREAGGLPKGFAGAAAGAAAAAAPGANGLKAAIC